MKEVLKYIILVSMAGLLQVVSAVWVNKCLVVYLWIAVNALPLVGFTGLFLYYRAVIGKYLSLNLRYLGDQYKPPFLLLSFVGKWLLAGEKEANFTDFKALTTYKYLKILQLLGSIFLGFGVIAVLILIVRFIK